MKKCVLFISAFLCATISFSQVMHDGRIDFTQNNVQRNSDPAVQNGSGTLGFVYDNTGCGINYTQASVKLGQRITPVGVAQPAPFPIANIPFCAQIEKAYLWCVALGNGIPITATITNPIGSTSGFPMTMIGQGVDMCWGFGGTYAYRADVTSIINGNGNYIISGLPVGASNTGNDVDGATLMVIYKDVAASYTGSIHIDDGCIVVNGGTANHPMTGFNSCANSTSGNGFMMIADLQMTGANVVVNGGPSTPVTAWDWWNCVTVPTTITASQTTCNYSVIASSDCFCLSVAGLYTQTNCNVCNPVSGVLTITNPSTTAASCTSNGAATIAVSGGSGNYVINWNTNPAQSGLTATNLPPGTYYVSVVDSTAGACGSISITIPYTGPVLTTTSTGVSCTSLGSASVTVSGGQGPFTYSWSPSGGNAATASNLSAGNYTVSVLDNTGCLVTATVTVQNNSNLSINTTSTPDSCPSPTGTVYAAVAGGQPPYSYSWMPGSYTTAYVTNLAAGSYTATVTDGAGCVVSSMVTVNVSTVGMTVNVSGSSSVGCGGSVQLNASTNYSPATFVWSPATYLNNPNIPNPVCSPLGNITYTVTATSACGTGTDVFTVTLAGSNPYVEEICFVSVDTAINRNTIIWERLNSPSTGSYNIYRETSTSGVYAVIGNQPIAQFSTFTDLTSNPLNMANRYKITTLDSCGVESDTSFHHRTLFLQVSPSLPTGFNLAWTAYEGLPIATYYVYRGTNPGNLTLLAAVAGTIFNWTDYNPPSGQLYYMVLALHPSGGCNPTLRIGDPLNPASVVGSLSNLGPVVYSGVDENANLNNSFLLTPNPGNGNFQLNLSVSKFQEIQVMIYDQLGRKVYSQNENAASGNYNTTLNLSILSSGVYFVQVKTTNGIATKRLVIE